MYVYALKHIRAVGRGMDFSLSTAEQIFYSHLTSAFLPCIVVVLLICTWKRPYELTTGDTSSTHCLSHRNKKEMHGSLKITAHSGLCRDSLTKCRRVRGEQSQKANFLVTKELLIQVAKQEWKETLLLTKLCIWMSRAADVCADLKNWWQKKTFPRVFSCCSVEFCVFSPESNSWPPLIPIHYKYIHS